MLLLCHGCFLSLAEATSCLVIDSLMSSACRQQMTILVCMESRHQDSPIKIRGNDASGIDGHGRLATQVTSQIFVPHFDRI